MTNDEITFRERLTPRAYVYVIVEALIVMVAIAYGAPFGARIGWMIVIGLTILAVWAILATSPVIEVSATHLRAGPVLIEREFITATEPLCAEAFRLARGRHADPRRYSVLRSWHSGSGVVITIADDRDPHPAWILTSARPDELAAALA